MNDIPMLRRYTAKTAALILTLVFTINLASAEESEQRPELPPGQPITIGDTGDVVWSELDIRGAVRYSYSRWNPVSRKVQKLSLPTNFCAESAAKNQSGLGLFGQTEDIPAVDDPPTTLWLVTAQNKVLSARLHISRQSAHLLALADGSFLIVGGKLNLSEQATSAVQRVSLVADQLLVETLPDIPGQVRRGYAALALADGRAMVLGGSTSNYQGTAPFLAQTYMFDPKSKAWTDGPLLHVPRSNASATLLPDGRVLVAGGWSAGYSWNEHADNSVEVWDAASNSFKPSPAMPVGVAMHATVWAAGQDGKELLLTGGMIEAWEDNTVVLAFDTATGEWTMVGRSGANRGGPLHCGTVLENDKTFFWCADLQWGRGFDELRLTGNEPPSKIGTDGIATNRSGMLFLPAQSGHPALAIGGQVSGVQSSAVDAIWPDGRIQPMASLDVQQAGGRAFRLIDGSVLVMGGTNTDPRHASAARESPPTVWWPVAPNPQQSHWVHVDFGVEDNAILGQTVDGNLIAVHADGRVERIEVDLTKGKPQMHSIELPHLNRKRRTSPSIPRDSVQVRGLADGAIVVAGGEVQVGQIALMKEDFMLPDAPDSYVGIGEYLPARRYEIFDSESKTWHNSAPSRGAGGGAVILNDGRVVRMTRYKVVGGQKSDSSWEVEDGFLEISDADGKTWKAFAAAPAVKIGSGARLFIADGELFLSGSRISVDSGGPTMVQWFDAAGSRWQTLWEAGAQDNWREHVGRIIVRTLSNGKNVVLPVEGF